MYIPNSINITNSKMISYISRCDNSFIIDIDSDCENFFINYTTMLVDYYTEKDQHKQCVRRIKAIPFFTNVKLKSKQHNIENIYIQFKSSRDRNIFFKKYNKWKLKNG